MLSDETVERGPRPDGWRGRVYVVEDDPAARARVKALLEDEGYAVTAVPTVEAAITQGFWDGDPSRLLVARPRPRAPSPCATSSTKCPAPEWARHYYP